MLAYLYLFIDSLAPRTQTQGACGPSTSKGTASVPQAGHSQPWAPHLPPQLFHRTRRPHPPASTQAQNLGGLGCFLCILEPACQQFLLNHPKSDRISVTPVQGPITAHLGPAPHVPPSSPQPGLHTTATTQSLTFPQWPSMLRLFVFVNNFIYLLAVLDLRCRVGFL